MDTQKGDQEKTRIPSPTLNERGLKLLRVGRPDIVDCFNDGLIADALGLSRGGFERGYWDGTINKIRAKQRKAGKDPCEAGILHPHS